MKSDEENHLDHSRQLESTGFWGRMAAGCLFLARDTGRLLVAHRSGMVLEPHTFGTWGGALDDGETPEQGVRREIREEAQYVDACKLVPLAVFSHSSGFQYHNFLAIVDHEFEPEMDHETQGFRWCALDDLPSPAHPGLSYLIEHSGEAIAQLIEEHCADRTPRPRRRPK